MGYDPPGPQRTGTAGGRILPARLNQSATSAHPERFIHIAPMSSAGPVGLRSERERERDLKVARPGRSAGRIVGPFSLQGPPARRSTPRPFPSEPGPAATAPSLLLVAGLRPAVGRPVVPTSRPTISSRAANFTIQNAKTFFLTSFLHHSDPIFSQ